MQSKIAEKVYKENPPPHPMLPSNSIQLYLKEGVSKWKLSL